MSKSILQDEKVCYISRRTHFLEKHHIFGAANRSLSEKYGLWVWLNHHWHNEPPNGAHFNRQTMDYLHRKGQLAFEKVHGTREDFMRIFGRNYL